MQGRTTVSQQLFEVFFLVTFWTFSTECGLYKEVADIILFLFFLWPTINRPVAPFLTFVTFSVESDFYVHLVFISFSLFFQDIWLSVTLFATLFACALEELDLMLLTFSRNFCYNLLFWILFIFFIFSAQFSLPEATDLFIDILVCHLWDVYITRYSYGRILFR